MANQTAIGWTDLSWNPVHGCSKVSPGCARCYAETLSRQRGLTTKPWTPENAAENVLLKPHKLKEPFSGAKVWRGLGEAAARAGKTDGKLVFVNSMSDLFHEEVSEGFIAEVFGVMAAARRHVFQVLTKRPERMRKLLDTDFFWETVSGLCLMHGGEHLPLRRDHFIENCWLGVSIENRRYVDRADVLRETPAAVRFISAEPLLGPLVFDHPDGKWLWADTGKGRWDGQPDLNLTDIDWLIVGGESGPGHRPICEEWVRDLRDACRALDRECAECEGTGWERDDPDQAEGPPCEACDGGMWQRRPAFFFKQWGGARPTSGGRDLDGRTWDEFPQVREAVVA